MLIGKYNHQVKGLVLLATILLFSCEQRESSVTAPDLILTNASVITMDKMDSVAEAVAVTGNKITAVGSSADLEQLAGPETTIIDLEGNTVSPGIIDTHSLLSKLEFLCINNNVSFLYNAKINNINFESSEYALSLSDNDEICSDIVVNCGGLWAHNISSMLNLKKYDIDYYKGDYYKSSKIRDLNCLIYPIPSISSLGIHTVLSLNGEVSFGPNIYKVNQVDYSINSKYHDDYYIEISKFLDIERNDIYPDCSVV